MHRPRIVECRIGTYSHQYSGMRHGYSSVYNSSRVISCTLKELLRLARGKLPRWSRWRGTERKSEREMFALVLMCITGDALYIRCDEDLPVEIESWRRKEMQIWRGRERKRTVVRASKPRAWNAYIYRIHISVGCLCPLTSQPTSFSLARRPVKSVTPLPARWLSHMLADCLWL